jgi:signal transduction histidine kinase
MHAQLWQERAEDACEAARVIEQEAGRIEGLVNQWMYLGKPQPPATGEVELSALLVEVLRSGNAQLDHAQVRAVLEAPEPLPVRGDARRLTQVFRNLLVNAVQAMPQGGLLKVTGDRVQDFVRIQFADEGRGFSEEALRRFAEFFYSEREGGMGIGLSVASEIVAAHGGSLMALNAPRGGACVTVCLPSADLRDTAVGDVQDDPHH